MSNFRRFFSTRLFYSYTDLSTNFTNCQVLEDQITKESSSLKSHRKHKHGWQKIYFNYLFLDPRLSGNIRELQLTESTFWNDFYTAVFYVGKGTKARPYHHLHQASKLFKQQKHSPNKKLMKIFDIWNDNRGVVCLHAFHNSAPAEAYTREAAMIKALGLWNLTNAKQGVFYGKAKSWSDEQKRLFGMYLLYRCMKIYLSEGDKELFAADFT